MIFCDDWSIFEEETFGRTLVRGQETLAQSGSPCTAGFSLRVALSKGRVCQLPPKQNELLCVPFEVDATRSG